MILSVTLNPSVDHALFLDELRVGDTNRVQRTERDAGGKGVNLSRVVAELGARTMATGFLGGGPGAYVRNVLDQQQVEHCFIEVAGETRINFSVESAAGDPPTTFNEQGPPIDQAGLDALTSKVRELLPKTNWVTLGGSLPPGVPQDFFKTLAKLTRDHGCKVALDADGAPMRLGMEAGPDFIKPNSKEAERLTGRKITSDESALAAAKSFYDELLSKRDTPAIVVLSMGERGAIMACEGGVYRGHSPEVKVRSTIGSGDSLIGAMLWAIEEGKPLEEAFAWGLAAGAATATTDGSRICDHETILKLLPSARVDRL